MPKEIRPIDPQLAANLKHAKDTLADAKKLVEAAEGAIYLAAGALPEKGTVHVTGCKISVGFYEEWSDDQLAKIESEWANFSNNPFPFKKVYKADGRALTYLRENATDAYAVLADALTLKPKKPSFELVD